MVEEIDIVDLLLKNVPRLKGNVLAPGYEGTPLTYSFFLQVGWYDNFSNKGV